MTRPMWNAPDAACCCDDPKCGCACGCDAGPCCGKCTGCTGTCCA